MSAILDISNVFVAPFEGILRTDALHSAGSIFDITAVVAFVGWSVLELIVIWAPGDLPARAGLNAVDGLRTNLMAIASVAIRAVALVVIAMLMILVLLPAALVAAGT